MKPVETIVCAIDPGYERLGIAFVTYSEPKITVLHSECFKTDKNLPHSQRLHLIDERLSKLLGAYNATSLSIESLFFTQNQKTVMKVAEARGVIIAAACRHGLEVHEFTPLQIKTAVTGYGRSAKPEMMKMIPLLAGLPQDHKPQDDEYDAIAAGITFFAYTKNRF